MVSPRALAVLRLIDVIRSGRSFADRNPAGAVLLPLTPSMRLTGPLQNATEIPSRLVVGDGGTYPPAGIAEGWMIAAGGSHCLTSLDAAARIGSRA